MTKPSSSTDTEASTDTSGATDDTSTTSTTETGTTGSTAATGTTTGSSGATGRTGGTGHTGLTQTEIRYQVWNDAEQCWDFVTEMRTHPSWVGWTDDICTSRPDTGWGYGPEEVYWSTNGTCVLFRIGLDNPFFDECAADDPEFQDCDPLKHACCTPISWTATCP